MMTKLKGLLYLKFVKQLFIISLISCFGFLGSFFVNAFEISPIGQNITSPYDSNISLSVLPYGSFLSNVLGYGKPVLALNNTALSSSRGRYVYFMWIDGKIYFYSLNYFGTSTTPYLKQGFLSLYRICDYFDLSSTGLSNCFLYNYSEDIVNDFLNTVKLGDYYYINLVSIDSYYYGTLCMSSSVYNKSICFGGSQTSQFGLTGSLGYGLGLSFDQLYGYDSSSPAVPINPSNPGLSGNLEGDSPIIYYSDNNQIYYDTFKAIGFDEQLCYSNFELNDVVNNTTSYNDLFPSPSAGSGASIFSLYQNWGFYPRNPFNSYYSWYSSRYNQLNNSFDKGTNFIMSLYSGVSIGNYFIFDKLLNNQFIDSYELSYKDYYCFCDMAVNGFVPEEMNHCDLSTSFDNIITTPGIRNGTSIGSDGNFILSGANEYGYFSGSDGIFDVFNKLYSQLKNAFRVDNSLSGTSGILPTYIIFGFFLFLLLYVLKR